MDHSDLKYFVALAETLHFAKAARKTHISPSALTRSIQRLEAEVEYPLFVRDRRNVELTPAGLVFLSYAEGVLADWEKCRAALETEQGVVRGVISVYSSVTAVYTILAEVLRPFRNRYPDVHVNLATGTVADAIDKVLDKAVDCAVAAMPDKLPRSVLFASLTTTELVFIAPMGFRRIPYLNKKGEVDWRRTPIIMPDRDVARERQERWFEAQHIAPTIFAEVAGNEAIIAMVSLGFGIGIVPEIVLNQSPLKKRVQKLDISPPLPPYAIGVVYLKHRQKDPVIAAFCEVARATIRNEAAVNLEAY
jgi:LysR family transcriptional regulator, positive regulator for ilvC